MKRVVSLYLPSWPTDRLRRRLGHGAPPADKPLILIGREGRRRVVTATNQAAVAVGVHKGMPATQASALSADLVVHPADPEGDAAGLERLAAWALRLYAPVVAPDPPDGLVLDVTGTFRLHGAETRLLSDMVRRLGAAGLEARAAASDSLGSAHALARRCANPTLVIPPGAGGRALAALPVRALRLDEETAQALETVGLDTIGELEARPRAPLALRFGLGVLQRLDQAFGRINEPIVPIQPPELITHSLNFVEPISAPETLARQIARGVEGLSRALEVKGLGARILDLRLHRVDGRIEAVRVGLARPVRDAGRLTRLLCDKLETIDPGFGVERLVLAAPGAEPLTPAPVGRLGERAAPDVSELLDTLANRLGPARIYRAAPAESDIPERSVKRVSPQAPSSGTSWPARWPRPARLLRHPEPIEALALLPDQPPAAFVWRGVRRRVRRADGPERIFGEWWRNAAEEEGVRDYFQLEDEAGDRFWVFRRGDGERPVTGDLAWFLHGLFG